MGERCEVCNGTGYLINEGGVLKKEVGEIFMWWKSDQEIEECPKCKGDGELNPKVVEDEGEYLCTVSLPIMLTTLTYLTYSVFM